VDNKRRFFCCSDVGDITTYINIYIYTYIYIYLHMNRLFSVEVRESLFLQLIPESHHCKLNETYKLVFHMSSSEFTFCLNHKCIVMVSYFSFLIFCICENIEILLDIIKQKETFRVMISQQNIYSLLQQISLDLTWTVNKLSQENDSSFLNIIKFFSDNLYSSSTGVNKK